MSEPRKMIVTLTVRELDAIVEAAVERALARKKPAQLQFTTKEAAAMLNVPESWLAAKARAGEIPFHQLGHYRLFSLNDIDKIMAQSAVGNGSISMIYSSHDGKEVQADQTPARIESIPTR
jgi:excisionase family DNA binding protein